MDAAAEFVRMTDHFLATVKGIRIPGRKFDRIKVDGQVKFFLERTTGKIYGAKSSFQYNPRREYGTLNTVDQMNWDMLEPFMDTPLAKEITEREEQFKLTYKKRGRPRKNENL